MVRIIPWPVVSFVCKRKPQEPPSLDYRGRGQPGQANDPAFYFDVPANIIEIIDASPAKLRLAVVSYQIFVATALEFNPLQPKFETFKRIGPTLLEEEFAINPPSVAAGGQFVSTPFAVAGAKMGDEAKATFSLDLEGMTLHAYVSSPGNIVVVMKNGTAGALNLLAGTLRIIVTQKTPTY